jgi:putative copper resistance protein D
VAGSAAFCAAVLIAFLSRRDSSSPPWDLLTLTAVTAIALVMTSHAAGRLEWRPALLFVTCLHQSATAAWIGGLPYLLLSLKKGDDTTGSLAVRRFSRLAVVSVIALAGSGAAMSWLYIGSAANLYGTSYGAMVVTKVVMLAMLLSLGVLNLLIARGTADTRKRLLARVRQYAEVEVGIGFTVILAAASLTSQPPAVDVPGGPVSGREVVSRMLPRWPQLETPPVNALSPATPLGFDERAQLPPGLLSFVPGMTYQTNNAADIAWSEYNHHWAGLIVLAAGVLAVAARSRWIPWARHWPLTFLALAVFLFLRADPENWPLGPRSFWQSFAVAEVLQHRVFVLMVVAFAGFEWGVRTRRIVSSAASMVFPAVCAVGGALLLTHTHSLSNIQQETLIELTHLPLALLAVAAGWSRWLELRLAGPQRNIAAWIWPFCFVFIGAVLLNYREA